MGLDTTHNCWHGPYSAFHGFRMKLAEKIGINLMEMEGFTADGKPWKDVDSKLVPLLYHSDCDGELTVEECKLIAEGLTEVLENLTDDGDEPPFYSFKSRVEQFRDGCLDAIEKNEPVEFH